MKQTIPLSMKKIQTTLYPSYSLALFLNQLSISDLKAKTGERKDFLLTRKTGNFNSFSHRDIIKSCGLE